MLTKITLLTAVSFAAIYPLVFWLSAQDPLKNKFHHFHLGLPNIIAGIAAIYILVGNFNILSQISVCLWAILMTLIFRFYWQKEVPNPLLISVPCIMGINTLIILQNELLIATIQTHIIAIISGIIFCLALYTMNLGHWYLNVHGLPIKHLKNAVYVFWAFLIIRLLWDIALILFQKMFYQGELIPIQMFLLRSDGFLLFLGIFFGTVLPALALFFVHEILKIKNTQAATGILYVILCSIIIGDLAYKYYLIKFGVAL